MNVQMIVKNGKPEYVVLPWDEYQTMLEALEDRADAVALTGFAERLALGEREIYVDYCGTLLGRSKLRIPAAEKGTGRNMNSVAKLAHMAREME